MSLNFLPQDLASYRRAVEHYANDPQNEVLSNEGDDHAIIIFTNIFRTAEKRICILARNLNNKVTSSIDYIEAMKSFLNKDTSKLDVILTDYNSEVDSLSPIFDLFRSYPAKVSIKNSSGEGFIMGSTEKSVNICTADKRMYRLEYDTKKRTARCNFDDSDTANKLNQYFDRLFNQQTLTPIAL